MIMSLFNCYTYCGVILVKKFTNSLRLKLLFKAILEILKARQITSDTCSSLLFPVLHIQLDQSFLTIKSYFNFRWLPLPFLSLTDKN